MSASPRPTPGPLRELPALKIGAGAAHRQPQARGVIVRTERRELMAPHAPARARDRGLINAARSRRTARNYPGRPRVDNAVERVQGSLIGTVLEDEKLSVEAADLVERAGQLVDDEKATVTNEDVERGRSFLRKLTEASDSDEVRADLEAVSSELERSSGQTSAKAIEALMKRPPGVKQEPRQE